MAFGESTGVSGLAKQGYCLLGGNVWIPSSSLKLSKSQFLMYIIMVLIGSTYNLKDLLN